MTDSKVIIYALCGPTTPEKLNFTAELMSYFDDYEKKKFMDSPVTFCSFCFFERRIMIPGFDLAEKPKKAKAMPKRSLKISTQPSNDESQSNIQKPKILTKDYSNSSINQSSAILGPNSPRDKKVESIQDLFRANTLSDSAPLLFNVPESTFIESFKKKEFMLAWEQSEMLFLPDNTDEISSKVMGEYSLDYNIIFKQNPDHTPLHINQSKFFGVHKKDISEKVLSGKNLVIICEANQIEKLKEEYGGTYNIKMFELSFETTNEDVKSTNSRRFDESDIKFEICDLFQKPEVLIPPPKPKSAGNSKQNKSSNQVAAQPKKEAGAASSKRIAAGLDLLDSVDLDAEQKKSFLPSIHKFEKMHISTQTKERFKKRLIQLFISDLTTPPQSQQQQQSQTVSSLHPQSQPLALKSGSAIANESIKKMNAHKRLLSEKTGFDPMTPLKEESPNVFSDPQKQGFKVTPRQVFDVPSQFLKENVFDVLKIELEALTEKIQKSMKENDPELQNFNPILYLGNALKSHSKQ